MEMKKIVKQDVQKVLTSYENTPVYLHVEITSGMYASHLDDNVFNAGTFLRNIQVEFTPLSPKCSYSLFFPFGFLGTKHTRIGPANLMPGFIVMVLAAKHTRLGRSYLTTVGIAMGGAAKQSRRAAADLMTLGVIVIGGSKHARATFSNFTPPTIIVIGCTK